MTSFIAKTVITKIFGETIENKFGTKDPVFEHIPATRLDGTPTGKFKKVRRAVPPGISEHDAQILTKVKKRAYRLDLSLFSCCGIRFGWSSVIGIFPIFGDFADFLLALMVIRTAEQIEGGLPPSVKSKMMLWALIDLGVGFVPFIGDIGDAAFKANSRNAIILEDYLREKGRKNLKAAGKPNPDLDPSDPLEFDRHQRETRTEHTSAQPGLQPDMAASGSRRNNRPQSSGVVQSGTVPAQPAQARVRDERSSAGGLFGFGGRKKARAEDVEMGTVPPSSGANSSRRH